MSDFAQLLVGMPIGMVIGYLIREFIEIGGHIIGRH